MKRISVFGATGSIGQSTLDLIRARPEDHKVVALTGGRNIAQLARDARELQAELAVTSDVDRITDLKEALSGSGVEVAAGETGLMDAASRPADWIMSAIVGAAGLAPGLAALQQGSTLALANKESLVTAGPLLMGEAERHGATILPVDSEHSAIFQALQGEDIATVERVIITASGGAFRDLPMEKLAHVTVEQASSHPNWDMGQRITIDSASMFNKALELIETHEFFGLDADQIEAVIHPESLVHALVGFVDGGMMAHVGAPDMRHAIGYALHWPDRRHVSVPRIDLAAIGQLNFRPAEENRYPALRLARQVMKTGGLAGAVFNGAKEHCLDAFIAGRIGFLQMAEVVEAVLDVTMSREGLQNATITLDSVRRADALARLLAAEEIEQKKA